MKDQVPKNPAISESRYWLVQRVFATHGIDAFRSLFSFQRTWHLAAGILRYHDLRFESSGKLRHEIRFFTPMRRPECGLLQRGEAMRPSAIAAVAFSAATFIIYHRCRVQCNIFFVPFFDDFVRRSTALYPPFSHPAAAVLKAETSKRPSLRLHPWDDGET